MNPIARTFDEVAVGDPVVADSLTLFPLFKEGDRPRGYLTLDEGLAHGSVRITEVSEEGSVPQLQIVNEAALPVLIVDGEELVGAKQNRIALNVLLANLLLAGMMGLAWWLVQ